MRKTLLTTLAAATLALLVPCTAAVAQQPADTATAVVTFFEDLAQLSADHKANCPNMGKALNEYLDQNQAMLRDAAYSATQASPEQEAAVTGAATSLGVNAGVCYEEPAVATFFERFTTLTADLG